MKKWLPEIGIAIVLLFFALRELGTFPSPWLDDSLFMIVAKELAAGRGYALPILDEAWFFPHILNVGPTIILPPALFIWLFGWSVEAARIPQVFYLIVTSIVMYLFTDRTLGRTPARWTTALLVTLSAFVNTGKPVLGEIPGFLFLLLGLWTLHEGEPARGVIFLPANAASGSIAAIFRSRQKNYPLAGFFFGLAVLTKLTYGIVYIGIGVAFLLALLRRDLREAGRTFLMGSTAVLVYLPWRALEAWSAPGFLAELRQYAVGWDNLPFLNILLHKPEILLRPPFLYFGFILVLGGLGLFLRRTQFRRTELAIILTIIVLFILYFLNGHGWYRHLLPVHLLLLPFVPVGTLKLLTHRPAQLLMSAFILAQFFYQLWGFGSGRVTVTHESAQILREEFAETGLVVQQPEIFVELPENENWFFLSTELEMRKYPHLSHLQVSPEEHCLPVVRKTAPDREELYGADRLRQLAGSYYLIWPPDSCPSI